MSKRSWMIALVVWLLVGSASSLLAYWRTHQRLGTPGVRIVPQPIHDPEGKVAGTNSVYLPESVLNYTSKAEPVTPLELGWLPKDTTYGRRNYQAPDGFWIKASIVVMGTDRTSIHKPQYCLVGQGWRIDQSEKTSVRIERPEPYDLPVMKLTASSIQETVSGEKIAARAI